MKSSTSFIVMIALGGMGALVVLMTVEMGKFGETETAVRVRTAVDAERHFKLQKVMTDPAAPKTEMWFTYETRENNPPLVNIDMESEARTLFEDGRREQAADPAAAKLKFEQVREQYRATSAAKELEMWEVATWIWQNYTGRDKRELERIKIVRKAIRGRGWVDTTSYVLEIPKPKR